MVHFFLFCFINILCLNSYLRRDLGSFLLSTLYNLIILLGVFSVVGFEGEYQRIPERLSDQGDEVKGSYVGEWQDEPCGLMLKCLLMVMDLL